MQTKYPKLIQPKISVVICNYNYMQYIKNAIDSVLNQTYQPIEVIVVDDGSTDQSVQIINTYGDKVKLIQKENGGQISAYNVGFEHISSDVVLFLDADDELLPNALEEVAKKYIYENVVKVHYKMRVIDQAGNDLNSILPSTLDSGDCGKDLIQHGLMYKSPPASGNTYRVDALKKIFPLPQSPEEKHGADYFCIYGIAFLGNIASVNMPLFKYRIHDSGSNIANSLGFGNAIKKQDRLKVSMRRWEMFSQWINHKLNGEVVLPSRFIDFTQQKYFFAVDALNAKNIFEKWLVAKKHFEWIVTSIWLRNDFSSAKKIILVGWVLGVLMMPRKLSESLARKVCNPVNT